MNAFACVLFAVLSIWDYPSRQIRHDQLRLQFIEAVREGDTETMIETCRKGVQLLPDDPTWHYNLACSLAYQRKADESLDELEKAIDLGFRNADQIANDTDLKRISREPRFKELVEYAREVRTKPILTGPMASVDATGIFGRTIALGAQNFSWEFDAGCFVARLKLVQDGVGGNVGDLYVNRDGFHSPNGREALDAFLAEYPGLTCVMLDQEGRSRGMDLDFPNSLYPYPVFGNCSRARVGDDYWRSLPRALMTSESVRLKTMRRLYLSNQIWVFPSNADTAPVGTNGDVFASISPYWLTTAGRSWSDLPYLRAALEASRSLPAETKKAAVAKGLLAPTIQVLIRKSLKGVENEGDYLTSKAHPTALPPDGLDLERLKASAAAMKPSAIPPLAVVSVKPRPISDEPIWPELTYATGFAWAYVLRAEEPVRSFTISAKGAGDYMFSIVHDDLGAAKLDRIGYDSAVLTIDKTRLTPTNRVDLAVFGRSSGTGWGAPSYVSFAVVDPDAPYSDPVLTPR
jgi:hypothetical protein